MDDGLYGDGSSSIDWASIDWAALAAYADMTNPTTYILGLAVLAAWKALFSR